MSCVRLGATPLIMDGLDRASVRAAVEAARPDVIVHQMTALSGVDIKNPDKAFTLTNRLRIEGTEHLIVAAKDISVPGTEKGALFVAQSFAGWPYARVGGPVKTEADPLDPHPPKGIRETHAAIRKLERLTVDAGGIVLRYGGFYGPGSGMAPGGEQEVLIRKRRMPLVGNGEGVWSFLHTEDLATATLAAIEHGRPGEIYNIVDDEPAPAKEWLPFLAEQLGAKPPRRVPGLARAAHRGPGGGGDDDRIAGRLERQGEGRAGLDAAVSELASGIRRRGVSADGLIVHGRGPPVRAARTAAPGGWVTNPHRG